MDCCVSYRGIPIIKALPSAVKSEGDFKVFARFSSSDLSRNLSVSAQRGIQIRFGGRIGWWNDRRSIRKVSIAAASAESSHCGYKSVVNLPLEPRSSAGKFLSIVLQNQRHLFDLAVAEQLNELAAERDGAIARKQYSEGSPESCLHRRIAELKELDCQIVVEDVMYMLIVHKFSEFKVAMVPRLSRCINHGRLEGWPSKDKELESIHSIEVLEMVREHVVTILGCWRGKSSVHENWMTGTTTQLQRLQLGRVYAASVMYGYFLKSACLRHNLDQCLALSDHDLPFGHGIHVPLAEFHRHGLDSLSALSHSTDTWATSCQMPGRHSRNQEKLKSYIMGFDPETLQRCAKLKSQEAINLIEKHSWALFGDEMGALESEEVIDITFASLRRLVLEAVAFGSFLWDVEGYVDSVYRLTEN